MADLFEPRGMFRREDPHTSAKAAQKILPHVGTIRQNVEEFARFHGTAGFTDQDMMEVWPNRAGSTLRTRRSELAQENIILDAGRTRLTKAGRETIVWVHRDFHPAPPPLKEREPTISRQDQIVRLEAQVRGLKRLLDEHGIQY